MSPPPAHAAGEGIDWIRFAPALFVLIWSTGFVVARFGMPHAPPFGFLAWRFFFSILCFVVWIRIAGAPWPASRAQWLHLSVVGLLMQAGYLGGVWAAVKAGMSAGTAALIVGLQPLLTAAWLAARSSDQAASGRQWIGLVLGLLGLVLVVWRKLSLGEASLSTVAMTPGGAYTGMHVLSSARRLAPTAAPPPRGARAPTTPVPVLRRDGDRTAPGGPPCVRSAVPCCPCSSPRPP